MYTYTQCTENPKTMGYNVRHVQLLYNTRGQDIQKEKKILLTNEKMTLLLLESN